MEGLIYGLVDGGVLIIGAYTGLEIDVWISKLLKKQTNPVLAGIIGAALGNTISDFLGALADPVLREQIVGITLGCATAMLLIPLFEIIKRKNGSERNIKR